MRSLDWILIQYDWCPFEERKFGHRHIRREDHVKPQGKMAVYMPRTAVLEETDPTKTLTLGL